MQGLALARGARTLLNVLAPLAGLSSVGFSGRGHRVHRDGARLSEEGYLSPRQGALVERHLSPLSPLGTLVSVVSVVSVLKKPTQKPLRGPGASNGQTAYHHQVLTGLPSQSLNSCQATTSISASVEPSIDFTSLPLRLLPFMGQTTLKRASIQNSRYASSLKSRRFAALLVVTRGPVLLLAISQHMLN